MYPHNHRDVNPYNTFSRKYTCASLVFDSRSVLAARAFERTRSEDAAAVKSLQADR